MIPCFFRYKLVIRYGFFRPYVKQVIYRFLDCGILHNGFARVKCGGCGVENAVTNFCWDFLANEDIFVHLAIRNV